MSYVVAVDVGGTEIKSALVDSDFNVIATITAPTPKADSTGAETVKAIAAIVADPEPGTIYEGKVERIVDFGAFINILPGKDGLLHISQISSERVEKVTDYLEEGQVVKVKVLDVDARGRIKLSMKDMEA